VLFNSFTFLIFFPVVVTIYFVIPHRWRWARGCSPQAATSTWRSSPSTS
jgi:nitrate reductase gamma subunit